jgi:hypothetical protein
VPTRPRGCGSCPGAARSSITADGPWSLNQLPGGELAARVIASFLAIRPADGRVRVDRDGDAVTSTDGD